MKLFSKAMMVRTGAICVIAVLVVGLPFRWYVQKKEKDYVVFIGIILDQLNNFKPDFEPSIENLARCHPYADGCREMLARLNSTRVPSKFTKSHTLFREYLEFMVIFFDQMAQGADTPSSALTSIKSASYTLGLATSRLNSFRTEMMLERAGLN